MELVDVVRGDKSFNVQNNINGEYIATVIKSDIETLSPKNRPKDQVNRIVRALQDEFSMETVDISEIENNGNGITFTIKDKENDIEQSIQLLTAFIY